MNRDEAVLVVVTFIVPRRRMPCGCRSGFLLLLRVGAHCFYECPDCAATMDEVAS